MNSWLQIKSNKHLLLCLISYILLSLFLTACSSLPYLSNENNTQRKTKAEVVEIDLNKANSHSVTSQKGEYIKPVEDNTQTVPLTISTPTTIPSTGNDYSQVKPSSTPHDSFICDNIDPYMGKVVGSGECVDLLKICAKVSHTQYWQEGNQVWGNKIPTGTAIATFENGRYPNRSGYHAALYVSQDERVIK